MNGNSPRSGLAVSLAAASSGPPTASSNVPQQLSLPSSHDGNETRTTKKAPAFSEIQPMDESDDEAVNGMGSSYRPTHWGSSHPMAINSSSRHDQSNFGGRTYHVSLMPQPPGQDSKGAATGGGIAQGLGQGQRISPLSSSLTRVATFVGEVDVPINSVPRNRLIPVLTLTSLTGSFVGGGRSTDGHAPPSHSPSPSPSSILTSHLRSRPDQQGPGGVRVERGEFLDEDTSHLLPHRQQHYSSSQRSAHRSMQQSTASAIGLLSSSLGVGQPHLLGQAGDDFSSNILSRPLATVHGSATGRERVGVEGDLMQGWGRRKSYAAKGAPPRSKWDKAAAAAGVGGSHTPLSSSPVPFQVNKRPPKSQSSAVLSSLAPQSPNTAQYKARGIEPGTSGWDTALSQEIAVIVGSLPASFGTPFRGGGRGLKRVESYADSHGSSDLHPSLMASPHHGSPVNNPYHLATNGLMRTVVSLPYLPPPLQRAESDDPRAFVGQAVDGSPSLTPEPPNPLAPQPTHFPICLICLEMLTPEDFQSGEAIQLECGCSGDIALRHLTCAIEWNNAKGNLQCELCKQLITNLPAIDPELLEAREAAKRRREPNFSINSDMTWADHAFDALR